MNNTAIPKLPRCGLALASLRLGIASYFTCGLTIIPAVICGILALNKIKASNGALGGRNQALAGIIIGATAPIVIAIIGLLASLVIPKFAGRTEQARVTAARVQISNLEAALEVFEVDHGFTPTTEQGLSALIAAPTTAPIPKNWHGPYLKSLPLDPWGHPFVYECPGRHNPTAFDLMSMGPDGRAGTDDDIGNWNSANR